MIDTLFAKGKDLFLSDSPDGTNISQIKVHFQHLRSNDSVQKDIEQLNFLTNAYLFREFSARCNDDHPQYPVLEDLKSPGYRLLLIKHLPTNLNRLIRLEDDIVNNDEIEKLLCLSPALQEYVVTIANRPPFANESRWYKNFDEVKSLLDKQSFLAVISSAILKQHCLPDKGCDIEIDFFNQGVACGYINMLMAPEYNQSPAKSFLTSVINYISRLYIYRELSRRTQLPRKQDLLQELNTLSPKLSYWIAKDWGLCDEILDTLRERFQHPEELSVSATIMQKSEHANLALLLYQHGQFTRRQTQRLLTAMEVNHQLFFNRIVATTH